MSLKNRKKVVPKIPSTIKNWDDRKLGADERYAQVVKDDALEQHIDEALGLKRK